MFLSCSVSVGDKDITHNAAQSGPITTVHRNSKAGAYPRRNTVTSSRPLRRPGVIEAAGASSFNQERPRQTHLSFTKKNKGFLGATKGRRKKKFTPAFLNKCFKSPKASHLTLLIDGVNKGGGNLYVSYSNTSGNFCNRIQLSM